MSKKGKDKKKSAPKKQKKDPKPKPSSGCAARSASLAAELGSIGLAIKKIQGDGNCLFRAIGDQVGGSSVGHEDVRARVADYISEHPDTFRFFVEDDEDFGHYVARMRRPGVWGGQMELQAASLCFERNICVYLQGQPCWRFTNFEPIDKWQCMHLSYHDGEHYNSVRRVDDQGDGIPEPIGTPTALPATPAAAKVPENLVQHAMQLTCCREEDYVRRMLEGCGGSLGEAIELIYKEMAMLGVQDTPLETQHCNESPSLHAQSVDATESSEHSADDWQQGVALEASRSQPSQCSARASAELLEPSATHDAQHEHIGEATDPPGCSDKDAEASSGLQGLDSAHAETADASDAPCSSKSTGKRGKAARQVAATKEHPQPKPKNNKPCPCGSKIKYKSCCKRKDLAKAAAGGGDSGNAVDAVPVHLQVIEL